jgi:hypothetical protein
LSGVALFSLGFVVLWNIGLATGLDSAEPEKLLGDAEYSRQRDA